MNYVLIDLIDGMSVISSLMIKKELFLKLSKIIHVQIFTMRLSMLALITLWIFYLNWLIQDELITFFLRDILMMICFDMQLFLILLWIVIDTNLLINILEFIIGYLNLLTTLKLCLNLFNFLLKLNNRLLINLWSLSVQVCQSTLSLLNDLPNRFYYLVLIEVYHLQTPKTKLSLEII